MDNSWSMETIQERAGNWSLEGDNELLNLIKSISKKLEERCTATNDNLNRLMLNLDKTNVKLGNATTKFLDLNNAKFVEHSVMDIDPLSSVDKCSTGGNDKPFVPLPKAVQDAVTNGLNMMDRCYEKVSLDLEDSDDDDVGNSQKHVVCRPKNPYINRPLPYLIGSKQWNEKWHIGLVESDEELLSDEELEEFSQSSEDGDSISMSPQTSNPPTESESDVTAPRTPTQNDFVHKSYDVENNSLLFGTNFHTNQEKVQDVLPTRDPNQNDQVIKSKPSEPPKEYIFAQQKPKRAFVDLFDDEPPLMNEPIPTRNETKPVNLFLDSDEEEDINPKPNPKPTSIFNNNIQNRHVIPVSIPRMDNVPKHDVSNDLFSDDVDNNNIKIAATSKTAVKIQPPKSTDFGSLFDDEPPDDFFDIIVKSKGTNVESSQYFDDKKKSKPQTKTVNLFESDDDDDDFSKIISESTGSSVIPSAQQNAFEDTEENSTIFVLKSVETPETTQNIYSQYSPYRSNTGPPETYRSFLDDEPPTIEDEKEEQTLPVSLNESSTTLHSALHESAFNPPSYISSSKIIYDDVVETLNSLNSLSSTVPLTIQSTSKENETQDETDQSSSFKKNLSIFANPNVSRTIDAVQKPKPNKLKTNFNINVAGLLPGAKLPSQKHTQSVTVSDDHTEDIVSKQTENVEKKLIVSEIKATHPSSTVHDKSELLTCLSKSRAKIQVQRRPSTRSGRKRLYKKSLTTDSENMVTPVESIENAEGTAEPVLISEQSEVDVSLEKVEVDSGDWLTEAVTNDQNPLDIVDDDWLKTIDDQSASTSKTKSNEDDWLSTVANEPKSSNQNLSHLMNYDWLIADSLPPEDINPPSSIFIDDYQDQDDWLTAPYVTKEKTSTVVDLPNLEDDWLTAIETKNQQSNENNFSVNISNKHDDLIPTASASKPSTTSVVDEDDDDNWLKQSLKSEIVTKQELHKTSAWTLYSDCSKQISGRL